jgi:hypothetical protein
MQAEFVHDFFSFVESSGAEFVIWFSLNDQCDCSEAAQIHLEPVPESSYTDDYVRFFEEFMCSPGIKYADGTPKQAWYTWREYLP